METNKIESKKTTEKINETKSWFFERIYKIDKPLVRLIKKKNGTQISKVKNERRKVPTDTTEIQMIITKYYEQLYANKLDNLEEVDKFLETCNLLRLNQEETENLNRQITTNENKLVIKKLPTNKSPRLDGFTGEFYQTLKEDLTSVLSETIPKI